MRVRESGRARARVPRVGIRVCMVARMRACVTHRACFVSVLWDSILNLVKYYTALRDLDLDSFYVVDRAYGRQALD